MSQNYHFYLTQVLASKQLLGWQITINKGKFNIPVEGKEGNGLEVNEAVQKGIEGFSLQWRSYKCLKKEKATKTVQVSKESSTETELFFANISKKTTELELFQIFSQFGAITKCSIVRNQETGLSKQYGFVTFESALDANDALRSLQGQQINGLKIAIEVANSQKKNINKQKALYVNQLQIMQKMHSIKRRSPSPLKQKHQGEQEMDQESKILEKRKY